MNFKQKLGYMFIGCLFTIAGYILASLGGITTHAQQIASQIGGVYVKMPNTHKQNSPNQYHLTTGSSVS